MPWKVVPERSEDAGAAPFAMEPVGVGRIAIEIPLLGRGAQWVPAPVVSPECLSFTR